jgi:DNA invertase Pin-like site-specific DNA recombinase
LRARLRISGVSLPLPQKQHVNPPIPLFKIPPAQWPTVLQRVAQGESLRQIARSYHTSYEAVRRVLNAARSEMLGSEGEQKSLPIYDNE